MLAIRPLVTSVRFHRRDLPREDAISLCAHVKHEQEKEEKSSIDQRILVRLLVYRLELNLKQN
jgi:hypothetical protein